jgi:hypothetical protein
MSEPNLSIDAHFAWMLCYLQTLQIVARLVASGEIPRFGQFSEFRGLVVNLTADVQGHALAIRGALPPDVLMRQAPWAKDA